jgi:hypothetical protein
MGNVYIKGTNTLMIPLIVNGVKVYKNDHNKFLLITRKCGNWYYSTAREFNENIKKPEKLSLNLKNSIEATITLKWIEHKKYFPNSKKGIEKAIEWAQKLEKLYYP